MRARPTTLTGVPPIRSTGGVASGRAVSAVTRPACHPRRPRDNHGSSRTPAAWMRSVPTLLNRVLPANPLARRLSIQSILYAVGEGAFITGSAVFFTRLVGLSAAQVGLGMTVAG